MGEARLAEILENVCSSSSSDNSCVDALTEVEDLLEEWWKKPEVKETIL